MKRRIKLFFFFAQFFRPRLYPKCTNNTGYRPFFRPAAAFCRRKSATTGAGAPQAERSGQPFHPPAGQNAGGRIARAFFGAGLFGRSRTYRRRAGCSTAAARPGSRRGLPAGRRAPLPQAGIPARACRAACPSRFRPARRPEKTLFIYVYTAQKRRCGTSRRNGAQKPVYWGVSS